MQYKDYDYYLITQNCNTFTSDLIELANLPKPKFNSHCSSYWTPGFAFDMKENEKSLILDNKATMPSLDFPTHQNADFSESDSDVYEFIENLNANLQNSQNSNQNDKFTNL